MQDQRLSMKANMIYNSLGSLFYLACQWLITVLVVRLGSYEMGGVLTNCIAVSNVLFTVSTFGIRTYQVSDMTELYSQTSYVSTRLLTCVFSLMLCAGYSLFAIANATGEVRLCMVLYMLFKLTESVSDVMQGIVQKADRMDHIFKGMLMRGALTLAAFTLTMLLTDSLPLAIVLMASSAYAVILFYEAPAAKALSSYSLRPDLKKSLSLLKTCWPLMLTSFFASAVVSIPRTTLATLLGDAALGYYGAVATPAVIVQTGSLLIFAPMVTGFSRTYAACDKKAYMSLLTKTLLLLTGFTIAMLVGAYFLGQWGLTLIFGNDIRPYAYLLVPVMLTASLIAFGQLFSEMLIISRHLKTNMAINLMSTLISLVLAAPLINTYQMNGVNIALCVALGLGLIIKAVCLAIDLKKHFAKGAL